MMRLRKFLVVLLAAAAPSNGEAQNPFAQMGEARKAIIARDSAKAFSILDSIRTAVPDHPNYLYLRAHANAMAGRRDQAKADIQQLLDWDVRYARSALRDGLETTLELLRRFGSLG